MKPAIDIRRLREIVLEFIELTDAQATTLGIAYRLQDEGYFPSIIEDPQTATEVELNYTYLRDRLDREYLELLLLLAGIAPEVDIDPNGCELYIARWVGCMNVEAA